MKRKGRESKESVRALLLLQRKQEDIVITALQRRWECRFFGKEEDSVAEHIQLARELIACFHLLGFLEPPGPGAVDREANRNTQALRAAHSPSN